MGDPNNPNPRWKYKEPVEPAIPPPPPPPPPLPAPPVYGMDEVDNNLTVNYPAARTPGAPPTWQDYVRESQPGAHTPYDTTAQDQARAKQESIIQILLRQSQGDHNSIAQQQLRQSVQAGQGQLGGAASARGNFGGSGAALRNIGAAQGAMGRGAVDASRMLMLQEQKAAQDLLAQLYGAQQGQDLSSALGLSQNELANLGLDDKYIQSILGLGAADAVSRDRAESDKLLYQLGLDLDRQRAARDEFNSYLNAAATGGTVLFNAMKNNNSNSNSNSNTAPVYNDGVPAVDDSGGVYG